MPGKNWDKVIEDALREARCVIVLWSRTSIESDWVRTEAEEAKGRRILVPVLIDDVPVPLAFKRIQAANLVGWSGAAPNPELDELLRAVSGILSLTTKPAESPAEPEKAPIVRFKAKPFPGLRVRRALLLLGVPLICAAGLASYSVWHSPPTPVPLLAPGQPVDWWFVYKFNASAFPGCGQNEERACPFGGQPQAYREFGQQFAYISSADGIFRKGRGCAGATTTDPLGVTFNEVYNGHPFFVVWNDQLYGDPLPTEAAPYGHSKGLLAWDRNGNGFVLQSSTPSWPASGSFRYPRKTDGNTLGCIKDNDLASGQHFFALKLTREDVVQVLKSLANANVVTDPTQHQLVSNGGPAEIQNLVKSLGVPVISRQATKVKLSSGIILISKPADLNVPPWQMVSALLGGEPLRVATWWLRPQIPTTTAHTPVTCWDTALGTPGAVEIATSGTVLRENLSFRGGATPDSNHAKIGVSTGEQPYSIFGDLNQQGYLTGDHCDGSQNGRGGLFYVVADVNLRSRIRDLIRGDSAVPN
jgi:hypothetical protein